ncbi:hypothetical protein FKW77_002170 [Venturia effusa]|uniref:VASt domain-containing protein n=1 Tax=Venturia effusa TaxID=50376 RepID=A0A517LGQ7_9PEZI|nr:hypothetical protein FKW77_002170 [Venturia effusa]
MSVAGTDDTTTKWSRSGFKDTFKRGRKAPSRRDSDSNSTGSATIERIIPTLDGRRRSSTDSSSALKKVLSGGRRGRLGKKDSSSSIQRPETRTSNGLLQNNSSTEDPLGGGGSEDYTEDEGEDLSRLSRPTISPHQSHAGYLTLSSPLINAETLATSAYSNIANLSLQSLGDTLPSKGSDTLSTPSTSAQRRSPSPGSRLKEAFKPSKRPSTAVSSTESETSRTQTNGGGGGLGGLLAGKGRKNSSNSKVSLVPTAKVFDDQPIVQEPGAKTPSPKKSSATVRPIITVPATPPNIHGPPIATVVTPPTPTDNRDQHQSSSPTGGRVFSSDATFDEQSNTGSDTASSTQSQTAHRRAKSATLAPSKLSNSISAPLTPAPEEVRTPGGSLVAGQAGQGSSGGFFSSMFSAAQNAANSFSNTIASNTGNARSRSGTGTSDPIKEGGEEVILPPGSQNPPVQTGQRHQLAVETLGSGNLSLSHLGISESSEVSPMASNIDLVGGIRNDELAAKAEDDAAARAVSVAYSEKRNGGKAGSVTPSVADTTLAAEESTPGRPPTEPESSSIKRAGSVRSRLSGRRRRTRGSSAATGVAVAPLIQGPGGTPAQRLTGFAVANAKRNRDFHNLFRSVPDDDYLIEDYSAALQREILLHGRLYISEGHICFSSNILGWVTNLVMSFDEVISVEKKSTAMIFQNGIVIQTLQARNVFASLLSRDLTYDLIISIWKISHPHLKSSLNGAPVDGIGTGDKTEKAGSGNEDGSASEEIYDEDEEDDDEGDGSFMDAAEVSTIGSEVGDATKAVIRIASAAAVGAPAIGGAVKSSDAIESVLGAVATTDFPGPVTHEATDCGDQSAHHEKVLIDTTIPAPLGKIYSLMFGPASGAFMRRWLIEDQKSLELQLEDDKKGLGPDCKTMNYSYIKPLGGSIGPKQTRCMISQSLEQFDLEKAVTVSCSTQNPDVPSGNVFMVKTRYCLMWGPGNATRVISTCAIEWSGKSWLKGPIEKGANDGQMAYAKDIVAALRNAVSVKEKSKMGLKGKNKGGKRRKDTMDESNSFQDNVNTATSTKADEPNWGLLEPVRTLLGPAAPLLSPTVIIAFLSITIFIMWWRTPTRSGSGFGNSGLPTPQRIAAYEEMWRTEESELWKWLEERVGLDGPVPTFLSAHSGDGRSDPLSRQRVKDMEQRLVSEDMSERQIREAIKITRERLEALEVAVLKKNRQLDRRSQPMETQGS